MIGIHLGASRPQRKPRGGAKLDLNSITQGNLACGWARVFPGDAPKLQSHAATISDPDGGSALNAVLVNRDGAAPGRGYLASRVLAPPGATSLTFDAYMRRPGAACSVVLALLSGDGATVLGKTVCALTASDVLYTASAPVTPGAEYLAVLSCNDAGGLGGTAQAQALVSRARLRPAGATGVLAGDFVRLSVLPGTLWGNAWQTPFDRYYLSSGCASLVATTDASQVLLEYVSTVTPTVGPFADLGVFCDETPVALVQPTVANALQHAAVDLPPGRKRLRVTNSPTQYAFPTNQGAYLTALYAPRGAILEPVPEPAGRRLVCWGDSRAHDSMIPRAASCAQGKGALLREAYPGTVAWEGGASLQLINYGYLVLSGTPQTDAGRLATRRQFVERMVALGPTDVLVEIGYNDWQYSGWPATSGKADFKATFLLMLNELATAIPGAHFWVCGIAPSVFDATPNAGGATMTDYHDAMNEAATSLAPRATFVNPRAAGGITSGDLGDGVHLTVAGAAKYRDILATAMGL